MSEWALVFSFPLKLIPTIIFFLCYMIGGRRSKWVRRYIGPVLLTLSCAILALVFGSLSWKILGLLVLCPILTLPYHSDDERLRYALALTASGLVFGCLFQSPLGYLQAFISFGVNIFFTCNHPEPAVNEEGLIAFLSTALIPFMVIS